ncbi:hypothetical protein F8568_031330 [Actinomadura sp. LD22]|uniref:Uncharacterized protein n=1 Tax=Actinomadura physcomitrii TaxID=2650748 RepID=A0A6I4MJN2_9ACTN|nr:hypothetical protein [Actinomadura physcomitrii]MWA04785.1 hypothetical protein [Actinomadura physcomitrii]
MKPLSATPRTSLGRYPERSTPDRAALYGILDAGLIPSGRRSAPRSPTRPSPRAFPSPRT